MKPGRPRKFAGKMVATIGVRAPEDLANAVFCLAHRRNTDVSEITRQCWLRLLAKEKSLSENCAVDPPEAMLTT